MKRNRCLPLPKLLIRSHAGKAFEGREVSKMVQLESFPVITVKTIVAEEDCFMAESTGKGKTKKGEPYNQTYCDIFKSRF